MVNKKRLIEQIAELVNEKKIEGIGDLRDESDRDGMRIVIELKRDAMAEIVINQLYKHTQLQDSFGINMLAIVDGKPKLLNSQRGAEVLPRSPQRSGDPAHRLRSAQGRRAAAYLGRLSHRARQSRCGDHPDPQFRRSAKSPRKA